MHKNLLFRFFGFGAIPKKIRPVLESEQIVVLDEGMSGKLIMRDVRGPGKHYIKRSESFSGCLVITKKRIIAYTFGKSQISISIDDPKISNIYVLVPKTDTLSVSFESSVFREEWRGTFEYRFNTDKAKQFYDAFKSVGAKKGIAEGK